MKKSIITLLLASFILTEISPLACSAIGNKNSNEPKKVSISKSHKQRQKSDEFKYEYINYNWWSNFNDDILNGYIDKAIKNNMRPCLNYHIKRCMGPCRGEISEEEYKKTIKQVMKDVKFKGKPLLDWNFISGF